MLIKVKPNRSTYVRGSVAPGVHPMNLVMPNGDVVYVWNKFLVFLSSCDSSYLVRKRKRRNDMPGSRLHLSQVDTLFFGGRQYSWVSKLQASLLIKRSIVEKYGSFQELFNSYNFQVLINVSGANNRLEQVVADGNNSECQSKGRGEMHTSEPAKEMCTSLTSNLEVRDCMIFFGFI